MIYRNYGEEYERKQRIRFKLENAIPFIVLALVILVGAITVWAILANERNRISEGTVVHKEYTNGYSTGGYDNQPARYHPPSCSLTIAGEKNGKYVEYTFDVPESEYVMYSVGDHYPKTNTNKEEN